MRYARWISTTSQTIKFQATLPDGQVAVVYEAVVESLKKLGIDGASHLFVTVLDAQAMSFDERGVGIGVYHSGIHAICIGVAKPDWFREPDSEWRQFIKNTVAHEVYHHYQDLQGTLGDSMDTEREAEDFADSLYPVSQAARMDFILADGSLDDPEYVAAISTEELAALRAHAESRGWTHVNR